MSGKKVGLVYDPKEGRLRGFVRGIRGLVEINSDLSYYTERDLETLQIEVYVMCGGGMLGHFAMTQPADFYIDSRVGRLPYKKKDIYQAVEMLKGLAIKLGKDPHNLPEPRIVNPWVW
jgi:hypothetical protein